MHKANTYPDEHQPYPSINLSLNNISELSTETEKKALHFFETGIYIRSFSLGCNQKENFFQMIPQVLFFI